MIFVPSNSLCQAGAGADTVYDFLARHQRFDKAVRRHMQDVRPVGANFVAGHHDHALVVPGPEFLARGIYVVVGDGEKIMSEFGVLVDDCLRFVFAVGFRRVGMQVTAQPLAFCEIAVGMIDSRHVRVS